MKRKQAQGSSQWFTAVTVLAAGIASAWLFRDDGSSPAGALPPSSTRSGSELPWTGEPLTLRVGEDRPADAAARGGGTSTATVPRTLLQRTPEDDAPPTIEAEYGNLFHRFAPQPAAPHAASSSAPPSSDTSHTAHRLSIPSEPPTTPRPAPRESRLNAHGGADLEGTTPEKRVASEPAGNQTRPSFGPRSGIPLRPSESTGVRPSESAGASASQTASTFHATPRKHVVRDGDTLASVAVRYYGDASWSSRIYAANREWLRDPDLLPVGRTLMLPDADTPVADQPLVPLTSGTALSDQPPVPTASPAPTRVPSATAQPAPLTPLTPLAPLSP